MKTKRIRVQSSAGPYSVVCGPGALQQAAREIAKLGRFSSTHIVSSPKVWRAVGKKVRRALAINNSRAIHLIDDAESAKNLRTVEAFCRSLTQSAADRKSLLIAVGGGVIGDVAGFAAASYLRGIALVQIPTTVVAQVDSSIGGKTGVNLPEGKNLVGAFYPPRLVLSDPELLRSLPEREFRGGLAEIIKHAVIADANMFAYLESNIGKSSASRPHRPRLPDPAQHRNQSARGLPRRARIRPARNPKFRSHVRPRPRKRHALQAVPARRSRRLGHDGRRCFWVTRPTSRPPTSSRALSRWSAAWARCRRGRASTRRR